MSDELRAELVEVSWGKYVQVGGVYTKVERVLNFGRQVDLRRINNEEIHEPKTIRPRDWHKYGFVMNGLCRQVERVVPNAEVIRLARSVIQVSGLQDFTVKDPWVSVGTNQVYVSGQGLSYKFRWNTAGLSIWSDTCTRRPWPFEDVYLGGWGAALVPADVVMALIQKHVGRISDPYAWTVKGSRQVIRLGGREK